MSKSTTTPRHLLSFVTDDSGSSLTVHADLAGVDCLLAELQKLRDRLAEDDCPHTHLFSTEAAGESLTVTKLDDQPREVNVVHHVKIYGWNDEWAVKHQLRPE